MEVLKDEFSEKFDVKEQGNDTIEALFERHQKFVCPIVFQVFGPTREAEDVVVEVFTEFWKRRKEIQTMYEVPSILQKITFQCLIDRIRTMVNQKKNEKDTYQKTENLTDEFTERIQCTKINFIR